MKSDSSKLSFAPATRTAVKPLIGLFGKSGSGKTMSALLVARGLVGPSGRIGLVDTENGRGSLFADLIPGGYNVLNLDAPFSPDRYVEAIEVAEQEADVLVIDSMSHEWSGEGGILDWQEEELTRMAGEDWKKREACKMAAWIKPKQAHKKMVMRLLRSSLPLICCLRAEEKTHMEQKDGEKKKVITDDFTTPLFDSRFIFEMLVNMETVARDGHGGFVNIRKVTHPGIWDCLPTEDEQLGIKHGQAIAAWASGAAGPVAATAPASEPDDLLLAIADATDGFELTGLVDQANAIEDPARQKRVKQAIVKRAKDLRFIWNDQQKGFITLG